MSSGALGRGSFHSVVAGVRPNRIPTYYNSAYELIQLHKAHQEVTRNFYVRDKVFDNKFPGTALVNGLFKMVPNKRQNFHNRELMESIRRRTIWIHRIKQQRDINNAIIEDASKCMSDAELEARFSYKTADSAAYFKPASFKGANNFPNFWQHPTERHVIPETRWRRVPELGGITRVEVPYAEQTSGY